MSWDNIAHRRLGTTQTLNPQALKRDIDEKVRTLKPESTPLITLLGDTWKGMGKKPKSKKIEVMQHYAFDHVEEVSAATFWTSGTYQEFARLRLPQKTRPKSSGTMYYSPQDMFALPNGQMAMVWVTPDACMVVNGSEYALTTTETGSASTTRTNPGYIVVRNVRQAPLISFTAGSYIRYLGRTVYEGQPFSATSKQESFIFKSNYVERKECVLEMTDDQIAFSDMHGWINNLSKQQEITLDNFHQEIEYLMWFGVKSLRYDQTNQPMHTMDGVIPQIRTNVQLYNPFSTEDPEKMIDTFILDMASRHGPKIKTMHCGSGLLNLINNSFRDMRRSDVSTKSFTPGLDITTIHWMGFTLKLVRNEIFRQGTPQAYWGCVIDENEAEPRININFETKDLRQPRDRIFQWGCEWQGSLALHREEHNALIRTYAG